MYGFTETVRQCKYVILGLLSSRIHQPRLKCHIAELVDSCLGWDLRAGSRF